MADWYDDYPPDGDAQYNADGDAFNNTADADDDNDGVTDDLDADDDGDGYDDTIDWAPGDPDERVDTDGDGLGATTTQTMTTTGSSMEPTAARQTPVRHSTRTETDYVTPPSMTMTTTTACWMSTTRSAWIQMPPWTRMATARPTASTRTYQLRMPMIVSNYVR